MLLVLFFINTQLVVVAALISVQTTRKVPHYCAPSTRHIIAPWGRQRRRRSSPVTALCGNKENDEEMFASQQGLQDAIENLLQNKSTSRSDTPLDAYSVPDLEDPSTWEPQNRRLVESSKRTLLPKQQPLTQEGQDESIQETVEKQIRNQSKGIQDDSATPTQASHGLHVDENGMFLDTQEYLHTRDWLNPDGSLNIDSDHEEYHKLTDKILEPSPPIPDSFYTLSRQDGPVTLEDLLHQKPPDPSMTCEEMHKLVFEKEEGYLQQSKLFRQALTNQTAQQEALEYRRGKEYRQRQAAILQELEQQIQEFEESILNNSTAFQQRGRGAATRQPLVSLPPETQGTPNRESPLPIDTTSDLERQIQEFEETLLKRERNTPSQRRTCSKCGCPMSDEEITHSLREKPRSKPICRVCYADKLLSKSRSAAMEDPTTLPRISQTKQNGVTNPTRSRNPPPKRKTRPPNHGATMRFSNINKKQQSPASRAASASPNKQNVNGIGNSGDQMQLVLQQMKQMEDQISSFKQQAEVAEQELCRLRSTMEAMNSASSSESNTNVDQQAKGGLHLRPPWVMYEDPETGNSYYWNKETGEVR